MGKISVVTNVVREEIKVLPRLLESVKSFADEIIIIDIATDSSELGSIAKKYKAKIYKHPFVQYIEPIRNFQISKATSDWVLIVDSDEEISAGLAKKISNLVKKTKGDYYRLPRKNIVFGKWLKHSRWWPDYNIRLFKKGKVSWNEVIHAVPMTVGVGIDLEADEKLSIIHHHYDSIEQYLDKMNRYTSIQANLKAMEGHEFSWKDFIKRPMAEFLSRFFAGEGYRDGVHGLAVSLLQAFSELAVYLKIWQKEKFRQGEVDISEIKKLSDEEGKKVNYWLHDTLFRKTGKMVHRLKRKFRIS